MFKTKKSLLTVVSSLCLLVLSTVSLTANAAIIVNATTTTDTGQGLEFLHIPQYTATSDYATALAGITFDGFNWELATVEQFISLMSSTTGVSLAAWDGTNHGDTNFTSSQADAMMASLGYGLNSITHGPWVWLNGGSLGPAEVAAHTTCCDDFHLNQTSASDINTAFFVRSIAAVPEPATLALIGIGLAGIGFSRRKVSA